MSIAPDSCSPRESGYIPTLDGWRAIAISLVVLAHSPYTRPYWIAKYGGLGVSIFFGISGLLICSRLLSEYGPQGGPSLRSFYIRRFFRIIPAAWCYLCVLAVLKLSGVIAPAWDGFLGAALFARNYYKPVGEPDAWFTAHFWSLAVEEHFYLLFPFALVLLGPKWMFRLLPVWALVILVWRTVAIRMDLASHYTYTADRHPVGYLTDIRLDGLLWGCFAAFVMVRYKLPRAFWAWSAVILVLVPTVALLSKGGWHIAFLSSAVFVPPILVATIMTPPEPLRPGPRVGTGPVGRPTQLQHLPVPAAFYCPPAGTAAVRRLRVGAVGVQPRRPVRGRRGELLPRREADDPPGAIPGETRCPDPERLGARGPAPPPLWGHHLLITSRVTDRTPVEPKMSGSEKHRPRAVDNGR